MAPMGIGTYAATVFAAALLAAMCTAGPVDLKQRIPVEDMDQSFHK